MRVLRLGDICEKIGSGLTPRGGSSVYQSSGIPLIRSQNVYNEGFNSSGLAYLNEEQASALDIVSVLQDDVLLNITGDSVARVCQVPEQFIPARVNQHVAIIRPNKAILNPCYLLYFLRSPQMQQYMLSLASAGGTRNALTKSMIEDFQIPSLPQDEQNSIVEMLGSLDSKIELNHQINETLEGIIQTLFKHWFVDFEFPNEKGEPYKSNGGMMKNSELGEIPSDWLISRNISDLCDLVNYGYTQRATKEVVGPKFLRVTDINKADWISWRDVPFCEIGEKDLEKYVLRRGDILIARMADPGKVAIFDVNVTAVFASYLIRVRLQNPEMAYYLYYLLKSRYYQDFILGAQSGSVQKNINAKGLTRGLPIVLPALDIVKKFDDSVTLLRGKINANCKESEILMQIRDSILPRMIKANVKESVYYAAALSNTIAQTSLKRWP
jgi:type I restriction enzyme S subunit